MDNNNLVNSDSLTPPTPPIVDVAQPGTAVTPEVVKEAESLKGAEWPVKKTSNFKKIFAGVAAIVLVVGVSIGAFYFTRNLNQASVPNAPESKPYAGYKPPVYKGGTIAPVNVTKVENRAQVDYGQYGAKKSDSDYSTAAKEQMAALNAAAAKAQGDDGKNRTGAQLAGQAEFGGINYSGFYQVADGSYRPIAAPEEKRSGGGGEDAPAATTVNTIADCTVSSWTPDASLLCSGTSFTQTNNCGGTRTATGTKTDGSCSTACTSTTWTPDAGTVCLATAFIQTSNCSATRSATGTKTTAECCVSTAWTPDAATKCQGTTFIQTSNCSATRSATGTKTVDECKTFVDLEVIKSAYRDQATNTAGNYKLTSEIDVVSKEQVFVYAIDVANNGNIKAENVVITDVLKGDNQELLTFVDAESRCKYTSATRTVTCSGMNLDPDKADTYTFRVKVSADAVNGDSIKNTVVATYKDMPANGDTEATLDLPVSTIVGCNHTCTGDDECVSGLTCDLTTNKCRKPACSDASNCNCPVERVATQAPVRVATARPIQPTVLPETGILDLPGVATFGGGLLLAVIGILLAL